MGKLPKGVLGRHMTLKPTHKSTKTMPRVLFGGASSPSRRGVKYAGASIKHNY